MAEGARAATVSPDTGKLRVFISYSRKDALDFADQLFAALAATGFEPTLDRHGISGAEDWKERLGALILEADTVAFVLSPEAATSPVCLWEVEEAIRLGKRIVPVAAVSLGSVAPPAPLAKLNYIFFYDEPSMPGASGFGHGLSRLIESLNTDLDWLREHTRLLERATEWEKASRVANRMLSGADIADAKAWAARRPKGAPEPTALHLDFIRASEEWETARLDAERQRLIEMAAAQEARAKALAEAEAAIAREGEAQKARAAALEEAAREQKARARAQRIIAWGSTAAALVLALVAGVAGVQWKLAEDRKEQATNILGSATSLIWNLVDAKKIDAENFDNVKQVFERGMKFGDTDAMVGLGVLYASGQGVAQDYARALEWYERAAAKDNADAMVNLGWHYRDGQGVSRDLAKAWEWFEKAAAKGNARAMIHLGNLHYNGQGVPLDYAKAREWWEKAAALGSANAMVNLGSLYYNGRGVAKDYAKARDWYEKGAALGDEDAKSALDTLRIQQARAEGRKGDALRLQEALAVKTEDAETKRDGKPGKKTAGALLNLSWDAVVARDFAKALAAGNRALSLDPGLALPIDTNRAHALLFLDRADEARALYMGHMGKKFPDGDRLWEAVIAEDFAALRKDGLNHSMMAEIEAALGVAPPKP